MKRLKLGLYWALLTLLLATGSVWAQISENLDAEEEVAEQVREDEQDAVSKAMDSTATQWSFQAAWQQTDWKTDMVRGQPGRQQR